MPRFSEFTRVCFRAHPGSSKTQPLQILVTLAALIGLASGATPVVHVATGRVQSVTKVRHDGLTHTILKFRIEDSATPILETIWLYNDETRLTAGQHVRIEWSEYGNENGGEVEETCRPRPRDVEPCGLDRLVSVIPVSDRHQ